MYRLPHRLYCFPHAGGSGYSFFCFGPHLPSRIEIIPLDYPGHGARADEPLCWNLLEITEDIIQHIDTKRPYSLFGHSMGSLVAWLVAKRLSTEKNPPAHLFVSSRRSPATPMERPPIHGLADAPFLEAIKTYGGIPSALCDDPLFLDMFLPILRADFTAAETFPVTPPSAMPFPVIALSGDREPVETEDGLRHWSGFTRKTFSFVPFSGGHFHLFENPGPVCRLITATIASC